MRTFLRTVGAFTVAFGLFAGSAVGQVGPPYVVDGGNHDFVDGTSGYNFWQPFQTFGICSSCHTAHHALGSDAPLWNHTFSSANYTMYATGFASNLQGTILTSPQGVSRACLSCHDGTVAVSSLGGDVDPAGQFITGNPLIGTDLTHTHPVSITYENALDPWLVTPDAVTGNLPTGARLYYVAGTPYVECGSCHDPHYNGAGPMIRYNTEPNTICQSCHVK